MDDNGKESEAAKMNKTWILVAVLVVITFVLLIVSLTAKNPFINPNRAKITPEVASETSLIFSDTVRVGTVSGTYEVDINIDTGENEVTLAQLEMKYNPGEFQRVDLKPGNFINNPVILQKSINTMDGRIKYWIGVSPNQDGVSGQGVIATLIFAKPATGASQITFLPKTSISATGTDQSVLKNMVSGYIFNLPSGSPTPTFSLSPTPTVSQ